MKALLILGAALLAGCGRYADFRLASAAGSESGHYEWVARPGAIYREQAVDTLNPSVLPWRGTLLNLYSVYDGHAWHTARAESADGFTWTNARRILSPQPATWEGAYIAANGSAAVWQNRLLYLYQAGAPPRIGLAESADGGNWVKRPQPVVGFGPRGAWDERAAADPYLFVSGGRLYLYYLGEDRARRQRLGLAVSDDGATWTKLRSSPLLELGGDGAFDENGLGEPSVWQAHGSYWMLYTGRARNEVRRLGLARSQDGVAWQRTGLVIEGAEDWDRKVICDPAVIVEPERVRVWYGGGDVAHPAENIHGQLGYGELIWKP